MPDETYHGNPGDAEEPSGEIVRTDTLSASARTSEGRLRLFYNDTVFTTGNGRVNADWAVTGLRDGTLFAIPYLSWFSPLHKQCLKFGWWDVTLRIGGQRAAPSRTKTWYEAGMIPVSVFSGGLMGSTLSVRACGYAPRGQDRFVQLITLGNLTDEPFENIRVTLEGSARLGEEAGSPYDAVNATVGDQPPIPVKLSVACNADRVDIRNEAGDVFARLEASSDIAEHDLKIRETQLQAGDETYSKDNLDFSLSYGLELGPGEELDFAVSICLANTAEELARSSDPKGDAVSFKSAADGWGEQFEYMESLLTPDKLLTAGLRRAAAYSYSLCYRVEERDEIALVCDHLEWPVDCARDCYHIANSLLLLEPEIVRGHLRFYFLNALPKAGPGKSYIGTGESRGHREARLLDLAAYPLMELYRYWRATGDGELVTEPGVKRTLEAVIREVASWRSGDTGLFSSTERSSDERCVYPYFIPGNMLVVTTLEKVVEMYDELYADAEMREYVANLGKTARDAIYAHAVHDDPEFGKMFAFEVGEKGECLLYDHADIPNLISMPRFGFCSAHDPIYRATLAFAYSGRNQGYAGTMDAKYAELCDGSKTLPFHPWPLGALSHLMSCPSDPAQVARLLDWLRDALTPCFQLPEISDKHTALPMQRYWFGWPTSLLLMAYIETICGVKIGKDIRVEPLVPAGWQYYSSPILTVRGHKVWVEVINGEPKVTVDGAEADARAPLDL
jgi:hypothetical protein